MKNDIPFPALIGSTALVFVALGVLVLLKCIPPAYGQYAILGFTLIAILFYTGYTYRLLRIQQERFQWDQNPTLGSYVETRLEKVKRHDGKVDFKTIFHIQNHSRTHAVARIDIRPKLDDKPAATNDTYSGKRWWYVPAGKEIQGNFPLLEILNSRRVHLGDFQQQKMSLTLEIKVVYKRWEQKQDRPMLENPPDQYYYNHDKQIWIHEPTTSEIQFPVFSENDSVTEEQER